MANDKRTTEDLRTTLLDAIDDVKAGKMPSGQARDIANLADKVLATVKLEMDYSKTLSQLDKQDQGISSGPILLTQQAD